MAPARMNGYEETGFMRLADPWPTSKEWSRKWTPRIRTSCRLISLSTAELFAFTFGRKTYSPTRLTILAAESASHAAPDQAPVRLANS